MYDKEVMDYIYESIGIKERESYTVLDEEYEYSADFVNEFCNQLYNNQFLLSEDFNVLLEAAADNITSKANKMANKMGISKDISSKINKKIKSICKDVTSIIKKDGITKKSRKTISSKFKELHDNINDIMSSEDSWWSLGRFAAKLEKEGCTERAKIVKSLSLLIWIYIINTIVTFILVILLGRIGAALSDVVLAPIVEENAKQQAIRGGYIKEFSILFNVFEFSMYVKNDGPLVGFRKAIIGRLEGVGYHLVTTFIQWAFQNDKVLKFLKIDTDDPEKKEKLGFIGNLIGILLHSTWNFLASSAVGVNVITY